MSTDGQKMTELQCTEHHTLKVPYELLNKKFRWAQKSLDREAFHVTNTVNDLEKALIRKGQSASDISSLIGGVMDKLSSFKRKATEVAQEEIESGRTVKRRVDALRDFSSPDPAVVNQWKKVRSDRLVVEYLFRSGYYKTAAELVQSRGLGDINNVEIFEIAHEVETSLKVKDASKCLAWCHDNKSKLKKVNSSLEFNIRIQEFIELIKQDKRINAVKHARKHFSSQEKTHTPMIQKVMALLAFPSPSEIPNYQDLMEDDRWTELRKQFRQENLKLFQISSQSVFSAALQCGLSALKTPNCYKGTAAKNPDCPVCQTGLNQLATNLPYAHCTHSRLVCYISGEALNEHNQPLMLPNGYIYGKKALEKMSKENNGLVICPRTNTTFAFLNAEKVYVM